MAGLRALLEYSSQEGQPGLNYDVTYVYNTNTNTAENGGSCCEFTAPTGATWVAVEVWGGGGGGAGARCCFGGWPGGSGSYTRKIINGLSGAGTETFTVCAAGSTNCSSDCVGCASYPSYVKDSGGTVIACASGGALSCSRCYFMINCTRQGCGMYTCGCTCGTFSICGATGSAKGSPMCSGSSYQFMPSAPYVSSMARPTKDGCSGFCGGCCNGGYAQFPGGGGASTFSHTTGPFCGAAGAGGLVIIYAGTTA